MLLRCPVVKWQLAELQYWIQIAIWKFTNSSSILFLTVTDSWYRRTVCHLIPEHLIVIMMQTFICQFDIFMKSNWFCCTTGSTLYHKHTAVPVVYCASKNSRSFVTRQEESNCWSSGLCLWSSSPLGSRHERIWSTFFQRWFGRADRQRIGIGFEVDFLFGSGLHFWPKKSRADLVSLRICFCLVSHTPKLSTSTLQKGGKTSL